MVANLYTLEKVLDNSVITLPFTISSVLPEDSVRFYQTSFFVEAIRSSFLYSMVFIALCTLSFFFFDTNVMSLLTIYFIIYIVWYWVSAYYKFIKNIGANLPREKLADKLKWCSTPMLFVNTHDITVLACDSAPEYKINFDDVYKIIYNTHDSNMGILFFAKVSGSKNYENIDAYQALLKSPLDTYVLQEQSGKQYRIDRKQVAKLLNDILSNNYDRLTLSKD